MKHLKTITSVKNEEFLSNSTLNNSRIKQIGQENTSVKYKLMTESDKLFQQNAQCHLCRYQDKLLNRAKLRAIANSIVLVFLVAFLIISYIARFTPNSNNICEQNSSPICGPEENLKSHFVSNPKCPENFTQEHQQWFDCAVIC